MRSIRYLSIILLSLLMGVEVSAQEDFNPASPADPGVPPQKLALVASPAEGGSVSGGGRYLPDKIVTVTAAAKENWSFVNWTDEKGNPLSTERSYKHTKLAKTETLTANFEFTPGSPADPVPGTQLVYFKLTLQATAGGTVSGGGKYRAGTSVKLQAKCLENFVFTGWKNEEGTVVSENLNFTYTTQEYAETLTATFMFDPNSPADPDESSIAQKIDLVATEGGTVSGGGFYLPGKVITLTANPNPGYVLTGWYLDGELYTSLLKFNYTVGPERKTFEARFDFNPENPKDPAMPKDKQYAIYLMSNITYPGKNVDCKIYLSNLSPLKDMHFDLTFPEGLEPDLKSVSLSETMAGYNVTISPTGEPNAYTMTLIGGTATAGNKEILSIPLIVPESVALGTDYQVLINQVSVVQTDNTTCTTSTRNGRVSIYKKGDTNGDGKVSVADYVNIVNVVLTGNIEPEKFIEEVSDINEDSRFSVSDVVGINNIILKDE